MRKPEPDLPDPIEVHGAVRQFYERLPFNFHQDLRAAVASVRANPIPTTYPDLHALLSSGKIRTVLEVGCGAGWFCNGLAMHYPVQVTAIDFTRVALNRGAELAAALGTAKRVNFVETDLFAYTPPAKVDLLVSLGVLHHTSDARRAFAHVQAWIGDGRYAYVGLYHEPGRRVFLSRFQEILATKGEEAAFERYCQLDRIRAADPVLARSWFRDQVLHPHESQHTLAEVCGWLADHGLTLESTSINGFGPIERLESLFELELKFAERSRRAYDEEARYFPGFFTFLCGRRPAH